MKREKTWKNWIEKKKIFERERRRETPLWKIKETDEWDNSISLKEFYHIMKLKIYYNHIIDMNNYK